MKLPKISQKIGLIIVVPIILGMLIVGLYMQSQLEDAPSPAQTTPTDSLN